MTIGKAVFMRPIEITSSNDSVTFNATAVTIPNGTYANFVTLGYALRTAIRTVSGLGAAGVSFNGTTGKTNMACATAFSVTWTDTALRDIFGYTGNLSSGTSHTSTYRPLYAWFSDYAPSDRNTWALDHRSTFAGGMSRSGELVGMSTGPAIYKRTMVFDAETADNIFRSANTTSGAGWHRCLETFIEGARSAAPTVSTNAPNHGFWYWYNASTISILDVMPSDFQMESTTGSVFGAWCHLTPEGMRTPSASLGVKRDWYQVSLDIHSATVPTWDR
jgi:hypothetical protein